MTVRKYQRFTRVFKTEAVRVAPEWFMDVGIDS